MYRKVCQRIQTLHFINHNTLYVWKNRMQVNLFNLITWHANINAFPFSNGPQYIYIRKIDFIIVNFINTIIRF